MQRTDLMSDLDASNHHNIDLHTKKRSQLDISEDLSRHEILAVLSCTFTAQGDNQCKPSFIARKDGAPTQAHHRSDAKQRQLRSVPCRSLLLIAMLQT